MLNLFKHQWLPDYIREYIVKKFPTQNFKVTFEINGRDVPMDQVVGNERHIRRGTDSTNTPLPTCPAGVASAS